MAGWYNFILKSRVMPPIQMLQYPMSLPISIQVTGIDGMPILAQALEAVRSYVPPTPEQRAMLLARSAQAAMTGRTELYKTTEHSTAPTRTRNGRPRLEPPDDPARPSSGRDAPELHGRLCRP